MWHQKPFARLQLHENFSKESSNPPPKVRDVSSIFSISSIYSHTTDIPRTLRAKTLSCGLAGVKELPRNSSCFLHVEARQVEKPVAENFSASLPIAWHFFAREKQKALKVSEEISRNTSNN